MQYYTPVALNVYKQKSPQWGGYLTQRCFISSSLLKSYPFGLELIINLRGIINLSNYSLYQVLSCVYYLHRVSLHLVLWKRLLLVLLIPFYFEKIKNLKFSIIEDPKYAIKIKNRIPRLTLDYFEDYIQKWLGVCHIHYEI